MSQYVTMTEKQLEILANGGEVELLLGKKMKRTLTLKSMYEIEKEKLDAAHQARLLKLEKKLS